MSSTKLELARRLALTVAGFGFTPTDEERWGRRMAKVKSPRPLESVWSEKGILK
jgi:hypothetical protein